MTMEEISRGLTQARADQERRRKLDAMCSSLADERKEQAGRAAALKDALEKENLDVERLERGGVTRLLYQVLGQLEEKSEKEKREAAAARVAYESCLRQLEDIEGELRRLRAERDRLSDADARYRQFYEAKQARLTAEQPAIAAELTRLTRVRDENAATLRELREASAAGEEAVSCAEAVSRCLDQAESWGVYDLMGGGLLADTVKHSHLDEAQTQATALENALRRFRTELCDVQMTARFEMRISDWDRFADFWFDGLFADWNMQSRIHEAQDSVRAVINDLREALITLYGMQSDTERACRDAEAAITRLIEG